MMAEKQYAMLIDLALCIGCNACAVACKMENDTPEGCFNTWVDSWDAIDGKGRVRRANVPAQCNHCTDAPCVHVCPTGASHFGENGLVELDLEKCIGCKYCMTACPYEARWVNQTGEVEKCTFCHNRANAGLLPACVTNCVTGARMFGDINDPNSDISKRIAEAGGADVLLPEMGLDPHVYYIGLKETKDMERVSAVHRGGKVKRAYEGRK